jgi:RNA polymerase sigma-70 factor (ECF subfamily)
VKPTGKLLAFRRRDGRSDELGDEALLAACSVGESAALAALYDRHHQSVFRFVSRVASAPASDVEDLVQCTFIEVWKSASRFRGSGSARSWIFGISANLARHYIRSEQRRRQAMDGLEERAQGDSPTPDERLSRAQQIDRLGQALGELSYDLRVAFVLCDIEELSGVEAARALGVRKGTMWRRLHDARKRLRDQLDPGGMA